MHKYAQICTGQTKYVSFAFISIYTQKYAHIYKVLCMKCISKLCKKICTPQFSDGGPSKTEIEVFKF